MPDTSRGADRTKVLSVRFTAEEFDALSTRATEVGVGPSTLARTLVRQGLAALTAGASPTGISPTGISPTGISPTGTKPAAPALHPTTVDSALEAHLQARLEALLAADLVARVEALERRTTED